MNAQKQTDRNTGGPPVQIIVEISPDKTEAYISFQVPSGTRRITKGEIQSALAANGVVFGIKDNVLSEIEGEVEPGKKILIAEGQKPENGANGEITYFVPEEGETLVRKDDKIAQIIPPGNEKDGMSVTREVISAVPGKEVKFPHTVNLTWREQEPDLLLAGKEGYFSLINNELILKPLFELEISEDGLKAWIIVQAPHSDGDFEKKDLIDFLKNNEIVFGVNESVIDQIFDEPLFGKKILIASGKPVKHGRDGGIQYFFETSIAAKLDEHGNVDYKALNLIQNVKKGDKLLEVVLPTEGEKGYTVSNEEQLPKPGKEIARPAGKNASPDPKNPNVLIADIDGHVKKKGKQIEVAPVLNIKGNVDYSTGNIDFIGSVYINGDVLSGFRVKARDDVEVNGFVEDALIEAGGDIVLKTGFGGKGGGLIRAKGKIVARFCENQKLECGSDIIFCEYLMHCRVEIRGKLEIEENKGMILGGVIYAAKGITAKTVGNKNYTLTKLNTGIDILILNQIKENEGKLAGYNENLKKIEQARHLLMTKKLLKKKLPENQKNLSKKLLKAKNKIGMHIKAVKDDLKELKSETVDYEDAIIKIRDIAYPGTHITINDEPYEVKEEFLNIGFKYTQDGVQAFDLSEIGE